jgi:photosystem II stability/assembly factor-like uncharacterized protein
VAQQLNSHSVIIVTAGLILLTIVVPFSNQATTHTVAANADHKNDFNRSTDMNTAKTEEAFRAVRDAYGKLPLRFETNSGQSDPDVRFIARADGSTLFLTPTGAVLALQPSHQQAARPSNGSSSNTASAVRMKWIGADSAVEIAGRDRLPGNSNYFKGNVPGRWQSNVPTFARVRYANLYRGINLVYYGNQRQVEYDFEVSPGADPGAIKMSFTGIRSLRLNSDGDLILRTTGGEICMQKPAVYQMEGGTRKKVVGRYVVRHRRQVAFRVGRYDRTRTLVIDPVLSYSSLMGGNANEDGRGIAIDAAGNAYVTGQTSSANFPTVAGSYDTTFGGATDVFVTKLSADGSSVIYSSYLGGVRDDQGNQIAFDSGGNVYVTGWTTSDDFPVTPGAYQSTLHGTFNRSNAFITKLNSNGSALIFSTYLGGAGSPTDIGGDEGNGIDFDSQGNVYVAGSTLSKDFPTTPGAFQPTAPPSSFSDGFVTKLNNLGTALVYSTYLGGLSDDRATAIKITPSGEAVVTGSTQSSDFPTTPGAFQTTYGGPTGSGFDFGDAFVTRLNGQGTALVYSTYLGGKGDDGANSLALGSSEEVFLTGTTRSVDFPTTVGVISVANGGVARLTNGVSGWSNRSTGMVATSILTLAVNPVDPSILYAGGVGGLWKSTDDGASWHIGGSTPLTTYRCSAIDPTNPSIIYAGGFGSGIYKSTNGGGLWASMNAGLSSLTILSLKVDPSSPQTVYVSTTSGVSKSTNGGGSWISIRSSQGGTLAIDPNQPATVYAGEPGELIKSTNAGASWNPTSLYASPNAVVVDPSNSAIVYAGTFGGLYKSTDAGSHWQPINTGLDDRNIFDLVMSPANPAIIYAGTEQGVFRTTDAGATWSSTAPGQAGAYASSLAINPLNPLIVYAGNEARSEDAFVTKLNQTGTALVYSTYLGGIATDSGNAITVDTAGNAYVTGSTSSTNFPTTRGMFGASTPSFTFSDAFVSKLNPGGTSIIYSTTIGGFLDDVGNGIALDSLGGAYLVGTAKASDFPTTPGAFQTVLSGQSDAFVARLVPDPHLTSDLSIDIVATPAGPPPITVSMPMRFEIRVTNHGPDPAYSVVIHDDLPISLRFDTCTSDSTAQCNGAGTGILGTRNKLAVNEQMLLVFYAIVTCSIDNSQTITSTATVDSACFDSTPNNNSANTTFSVVNPTTKISPFNQLFPASGGSGTLNVSRGSQCSWDAQSNANWITITSSDGCCDGTVHYSVATNISPNPRTGTITIGGQTFTVDQDRNIPTAIGLMSFSATPYNDGVYLSWQTGVEVNNLGFRLHRDVAGKRSAVNDEIIAGSALSVGEAALQSGREYDWWDKNGDAQGLQYWLEDIDLNGTSTWHGPFAVTQFGGKPPGRGSAALLTQLEAKPASLSTRPALLSPAPTMAQQLVQLGLASQPAVKLSIREEGWYRITPAELQSAGFSISDPRYLQLYAEGIEQAIDITNVNDKDGKAGAYVIEFFATGIDTPATDTRVYWLINGNKPGKRIQILKTETTGGGAHSFNYTVERRDRSIYFAALRNGEVENFFGQLVASQPVSQTLRLTHIDPDADGHPEVEVALQGVTDLPVSPDHSVEVSLNGRVLGHIAFDGQQHHVETFTIDASLLREGNNTLVFSAKDIPADITLIDYARITYSHTFEADQDKLHFVASSTPGAQTISGFSSDRVRVIDVSDTSAVSEIVGRVEAAKDGSYSITVDTQSPRSEMFAFTEAQAKHPAAMILNRPSSLRQPQAGADLVIVTRGEMIPAIAALAQLRQKQGLSVTVVDIEDVYDEFNFGEKSPGALKSFLFYTQTNWKKKPSYVLLAGSGSFDPRHYLGGGETDLIPAKLIDTTYLETASDDWYVDFNNDGVADIAIGRLPVRTSEEASLVVNKLVAYDKMEQSAEALLVADANDDGGFDFEKASSALVPLLPHAMQITQLNRGQTGDAQARQRLLDTLSRGPKLVNYIGHGSADAWRGRLLTTVDAGAVTNRSRLSVYVLMTCLNGYYDAGAVSLGEAFMNAPGGAVAVWASTGMSQPEQQAKVNQEFYKQALRGVSVKGAGLRLGDAVQRAKAATADADVRRTWVLLGDPTLRL